MPDWLKEAIGLYGVPVVVMGYYMYKDWKFSASMLEALTMIKDYIAKEKGNVA
jgi:hypothetical protein